MELKDKNVLIVGMARSGISGAKLCKALGACVTLYDGKSRENFQDRIDSLKEYDFDYRFGPFDQGLLEGLDYMIISPGVPTDLIFIQAARDAGIKVMGEVELAYNHSKGDMIAITGTNGKTTTTTLVGEIIKAYNDDSYVVGNIGTPFSDVAMDTKEASIVVAEISSFQLESTENFRPKVSALLNITEDHLNRHKTLENYINTKLKITENQDKGDYCILNYDDKLVRELGPKIPGKVVWFSMKKRVEGAYLDGDKIYLNMDNDVVEVLSTNDIFVLGRHNIENIMAAILMTYVMGVPIEVIRRGVKGFQGVRHRIQFVRKLKGVSYYNDSKATNPDAAIKAIEAMVTPTVLIAGGMDKKSNYEEWINAFSDRVLSLILYGETKEDIKKVALKLGFNNIKIVNDLSEAVERAATIAKTDESVLFSPACASWDMFRDFEERGDLFIQLVESM